MKAAAVALAVLVLGVATIVILRADPQAPRSESEGDPAPAPNVTPDPVPDLPPPPAADEPGPAGEAPEPSPAGEETEPTPADNVDTSKPVSAEKLLKETMVTFEWNQATALEALAALAGEIGVPIVVPEDIRSRLERGGMSLAFKELSAESALDLLLALAGADYTWETKDGKILIVRK